LDRATREELKRDPVAAELGHTFEYVATHRQRVMRIGGAVIAVALVIAGYVYYRDRQTAERQGALAVALRVRDAQVAPAPAPGDPRLTFTTLGDKQTALRKALLDVISKYPGSDEAAMAHYQLGVLSSDEGKSQEAEQQFKQAEAAGSKEYRSAARWALQEIYAGDGRTKEAEAILRDFVANPTDLVSKEQATIELAKLLSKTNPTEARTLVEPLSRSDRPAVQRYAQSVMVQLPAPPTPANTKGGAAAKK
jgi:tetratricopeptide (TPR) repeat protein